AVVAGGAGGVLAQAEDHPADAAPEEFRGRVYGADAGGVDAGRQRRGLAARGVVAAIFGDPAAPAAAAGHHAVALDDEIGPVGDDLAVDAHQPAAGGDLVGRQEVGQRAGDGAVHQGDEDGDVGLGGDAV